MPSFIPKQTRKEREQITIRLDRDVLQTLESYCKYLESARDYVIGASLEFIFRKDKDFAEWLESHREDQSPGGSVHTLPDRELEIAQGVRKSPQRSTTSPTPAA